ncbi:hypothetical protein [Sorangium sp. So ce406]|uniref:hypothetical protein n=1 Tax=Sorangium sp. So ce406 TaxID=3133311 RepID=UPI003F5C5CBD
MKILSFAAILVTVCAAAACSDDGGSGGDGGAGGGGGASGSTTSTTSSGSGSSVTTGTGGSGEGGSGEGGGGEGGGGLDCTDQCFEDNQQGGLEFLQFTLDACGCAEGATCASTCDTTDEATDVCGDDGSGDLLSIQGNAECVECLEGLADEDACIKTVEDACTASEGCNAFAECVAACP